jgi:hypothetical protein
MPNSNRRVSSIDLASLTWPFFWIKLANVWILALAIWNALRMVALLLQGDFKAVLFSLVLFSPLYIVGWMAWRNVSVLRSIVDRWMVPALLLLTVYSLAVVALVVLALDGSPQPREQLMTILTFGFYAAAGVLLSVPAIVAILSCRTKKIDGLDITLKALCARFVQHASGVRHKRPKADSRGWFWLAGAVALAAGAERFLSMEVLMAHGELRSVGDAVNVLQLVAVLKARSAFQPDAAALLAVDFRPPVLYLRSFSDDVVRQRGNSAANALDYNLESRLAMDFSAKGPFVAVASPKSTGITLGAARARLTDDEWQDQVIKWMNDASMIVVVIGVTAWVDWELRQVLTRNLEHKLLICFPQMGLPNIFAKDARFRSRKKLARARLETLQAAFAGTAWHAQLMALDDPVALRSIVCLPEGRIVAIRARSRSRNAHHLAALTGCYLLDDPSARARLLQDAPVVEGDGMAPSLAQA